MSLRIETKKPLEGMGYHGTAIFAYFKDLKAILGNPSVEANWGKQDHPNYQWYRQTSDGNPFIIMDKGCKKITGKKPFMFYIFAQSKEISDRVFREIGEAGANLGIMMN